MEAAGLVRRARNPANRRVHDVELTPAGEALFRRMVSVVQDFDRRLREGLGERELASLRALLQRLGDNAASATSQEGAHA